MGSFPTILKFDSLGQYYYILVKLLYFLYKYIFLHLFLLKIIHKNTFLKLSTQLITNNTFKFNNHQIFLKNNFFEKFFKNKLKGLTLFCIDLFFLKKNIIFIDFFYNYNYLPINKFNFLKNSSKKLFKFITFFNVGAIIFLNLNQKKNLFKKYFNFNLVNIAVCKNQRVFDINLMLPNTPLIHYILQVYIFQIYLKINK